MVFREVRTQTVIEWIEELGKILKAIRDFVEEREKDAKVKMEKYYDRNAKLREFSEGSLVLVRTPELLGKRRCVGRPL